MVTGGVTLDFWDSAWSFLSLIHSESLGPCAHLQPWNRSSKDQPKKTAKRALMHSARLKSVQKPVVSSANQQTSTAFLWWFKSKHISRPSKYLYLEKWIHIMYIYIYIYINYIDIYIYIRYTYILLMILLGLLRKWCWLPGSLCAVQHFTC